MSASKNIGGLVIGGLGAVILFVLYEHLKKSATVAAANAPAQALASAPTLPHVDGSNPAIVPGVTPTLEPGGEYTCGQGQYAAIDAVTGKLYCVYEGQLSSGQINLTVSSPGSWNSIQGDANGITGTF